jgi:hypothetical protein
MSEANPTPSDSQSDAFSQGPMSQARVVTPIVTRRSPPVPVTREALIAQSKLSERSLISAVVDYVVKLWDREDFRALLESCYPEETVEGSFAADNQMASYIIREQAKADRDHFVARRKITVLMKALTHAVNRLNLNRRDRATGTDDE